MIILYGERMNVTIWHNAQCSKSRAALEYLEKKKLNINIVNYLENKPSASEIKAVLKKGKMKLIDLIRSSETLYEELNIKNINNEKDIIDLLAKHSSLLQRPIIITNEKAVIARPFENLTALV